MGACVRFIPVIEKASCHFYCFYKNFHFTQNGEFNKKFKNKARGQLFFFVFLVTLTKKRNAENAMNQIIELHNL